MGSTVNELFKLVDTCLVGRSVDSGKVLTGFESAIWESRVKNERVSIGVSKIVVTVQ